MRDVLINCGDEQYGGQDEQFDRNSSLQMFTCEFVGLVPLRSGVPSNLEGTILRAAGKFV